MKIIDKGEAGATIEFDGEELRIVFSAMVKTLLELDQDLHLHTGFDRPKANDLLTKILQLRAQMNNTFT